MTKKLALSLILSLSTLVLSSLYGWRLGGRTVHADASGKHEGRRLLLGERISPRRPNAHFNLLLAHNLKIWVMLVAGSVTCGLQSVIVLGTNGVGFGWSLRESYALSIPGIRHPLMLLLPHSIPEILGFLLAASGGFRILIEFLYYLEGAPLDFRGVARHLVTLFAVSALLIILAAWIEAYASLRLAAE